MEAKPERTGVAKANAERDMGTLFDHRLRESEIATTQQSSAKRSRRSKLQIVPSRTVTERVCEWIQPHEREMSLVSEQLKTVFRQLANGERDWPLFLHGNTGAGKTGAALALADFVELAFYAELDQLCTDVMKGDVNWDLIGWAELAILDEIGMRLKSTDLHYATVKTFWERRERRGQRSIYISNVPPNRIAEIFDDRIADRLLPGTVIEVTGDSRRFTK